jgi:4-hydroxy-tetrahydrodipicolinate synthase
MNEDESIAITKRVVSQGRVPVIVGVSAPGFSAMHSLARGVMELGIAVVMIAPPSSLRTDDQTYC